MAKGRKSKYWYLSQFNLARRLKRSELKYLCENSLMQTYSKGDEVFLKEGDSSRLFFLKKGAIKLIKLSAQGQSFMENVIGQGTLFGLTSLFHNADYSKEKFICLKNTRVCKVPHSILDELLNKNKSLHNYLLKLSGIRIKRLEYRLESLLFKTYEERIREFFPNFIKAFGTDRGPYYEMDLFLTNKDIGQLTNTTRQKVNTVMNDMKHEGLISFDRKSIKWHK